MNQFTQVSQSNVARLATASKSLLTNAITVASSILLWVSAASAEGDRGREGEDKFGRDQEGIRFVAAPESKAYGKSLKEWLGTYWRWTQAGQDPASSSVNGVRMMPLPVGQQLSGTGTPEDPSVFRGRLEITIDSDTPFVLPLAAWLVERYNNGTPDDPIIDNDIFLAGVSPRFTIDNRLVISDRNEERFYISPAPFTPIVNYPAPTSYGSVASTAFQSIGLVVRPLPVGVHVLHLDESYILPGLFGTIFDNTWVITVKKAQRH